MLLLRKFLATLFQNIAFAMLFAMRWKRNTVIANQSYVGIPDEKLYPRMLHNLAYHASEMLFRFGTYKKLPADTELYPCRIDGWNFDIEKESIPVIKKMRHGGIFLTAHYGNYEASGAWLCSLGVPLKASYIPLRPAWLNRIIERKIRCVNNRPYSVNAHSPRDFLNVIDQKELFCLLADQDSRIPSAGDATLLGKKAKFNPLPDFLLRHHPETPSFFCWIEESEHHAKKILHAIEVEISSIQGGTGLVDGPYHQWLEERIKENPYLWYGWTHRRFYCTAPHIYDFSSRRTK